MSAPNQHDNDGKPLLPGDKVLVYSKRFNAFSLPGVVCGPGSGMDYGAVIVKVDGRERDFSPGWLKKVDVAHNADVKLLVSWISDWVQKMHRDISDEERGRIADNMCCDWVNSGLGASFKETAETQSQ